MSESMKCSRCQKKLSSRFYAHPETNRTHYGLCAKCVYRVRCVLCLDAFDTVSGLKEYILDMHKVHNLDLHDEGV